MDRELEQPQMRYKNVDGIWVADPIRPEDMTPEEREAYEERGARLQATIDRMRAKFADRQRDEEPSP